LELRTYRKFLENSTRNFAFAHRARPRIILRFMRYYAQIMAAIIAR